MRTDRTAVAAERREQRRATIRPAVDAAPKAMSTARQWEEEDQLRQIETVLTPDGANASTDRRAYRRELARFDLGHALPGAWHRDLAKHAEEADARNAAETTSPDAVRATQPAGRTTIGTWTYLALLIGTTALVCGGSLLGWSMISGRGELWNLGLPIALVGQIGLLAALLIQLERLWAENRRSAERIETVHSKLHDLQHATTLLGTSATSPASQFYAHYAHGADAKVLLTDLKSQLDLLALRVSQQRDRSP